MIVELDNLKEIFDWKSKEIPNFEIILENARELDGYAIRQRTDVDLIKEKLKDNVILFNEHMIKNMLFFNYFEIKKTNIYASLIWHDALSSASLKFTPDEIMGLVNQDDIYIKFNNYKFKNNLQEYVFEFSLPLTSKLQEYFNKCWNKFPLSTPQFDNFSLVITNLDRFKQFNDNQKEPLFPIFKPEQFILTGKKPKTMREAAKEIWKGLVVLTTNEEVK